MKPHPHLRVVTTVTATDQQDQRKRNAALAGVHPVLRIEAQLALPLITVTENAVQIYLPLWEDSPWRS